MLNDLINYLQMPFVQRAIVGGILIALLSSIMGNFSGLRHSYFFAESLAHSSLAGIALGIFIKQNPFIVAVIYSLSVSLVLPQLKKISKISYDNLLGIVLPTSMALGILLFSALPGYQPQLFSYLFGNILSISNQDIWLLILITIIFLPVLFKYMKSFVLISIDKTYAKLIGIKTVRLEFIYHVLMALIVIAGARLVGIVLLNTLFIIPHSIAQLHAKSLQQTFLLTGVVSVACVVLGILSAIIFNTPPGVTIALITGIIFFVDLLFVQLKK